VEIRVYAHTSTENMYTRGKDAGLSEKAADFFCYFQEVALDLEVAEDGTVTGCKAVFP
jgi:hypothetical protein